MIAEPEVNTMTPLLLQMYEQPVDIVVVHLHIRISERRAFHKIGKVVDQREGRAKFTRQASPAGNATRVNEVKGANSVVRQAPEQGAKNHFAAPRRDVLKHDERVKEVEVAG